MTETSRSLPARVAIPVLAAVAVALLVLTAVLGAARWKREHYGATGLGSAEQAAVTAAKQETINLQTYRLKSFDSDFAAALAGLTSTKAVQWQANKATLKSRLTQLKQDAGATVAGAGLVSFDGTSAVVVVASDTMRVSSAGKTTTAAQNRSQVTMKLVGGKWLMDDLQSVSVS